MWAPTLFLGLLGQFMQWKDVQDDRRLGLRVLWFWVLHWWRRPDFQDWGLNPDRKTPLALEFLVYILPWTMAVYKFTACNWEDEPGSRQKNYTYCTFSPVGIQFFLMKSHVHLHVWHLIQTWGEIPPSLGRLWSFIGLWLRSRALGGNENCTGGRWVDDEWMMAFQVPLCTLDQF